MTPRDTPESLHQLATQLRRSGRAVEAIDAYQRLLKLRPALPDSWYNLALMQKQARRYEDALASYQQALNRSVGDPEEVHLNRAVIFADHLARPEAAQRELEAALALNPGYIPALLNLGNLHEDRGDREAALAAYQRVLVADGGNIVALSRIAGVKVAADAADPLIESLKRALSRPGLKPDERAALGFGLGKLLNDAAAYDGAFAAYVTANQYSRAVSVASGQRYDHSAHEQYVDRLISAFPLPVSPPPSTGGRRPPIFICGMFRSGSTLVEQILASHSRVSAGGELELMPAMVNHELRPFPESLSRLDSARLRQLGDAYLDRVQAMFPSADHVTDKRPDNFLYVGLIKTLFPDAKIVHTRRNPLDNCLSVYFLHLDHSMPYATDLRDIAHWYQQYQKLMRHWSALYGDSILDVDYDELVANPRPLTERLLSHCELDWDERCMEFHRAESIVKTASVWQVRHPLYQRASGRWRHYQNHLQPLLAVFPQA